MADENFASPMFASPAAVSDADEMADKESSAVSVDGEEETAGEEAAAAAGDRDAAVELLLEEIRGLKNERSDLQRERSGLLLELSDVQTKLASADLELKAVAAQASRLEGELRIVHDDLSTANMAAMEHEEEVRRLESSLKDVEARFKVKINDLENTVKVLEEELRVSKQKAKDAEEIFATREEELGAKIAELRSKLVVEKEKEKGPEIDGKEDARIPPMNSQAVGAAAAIGVVVLVAGAVVCLHLAKRR